MVCRLKYEWGYGAVLRMLLRLYFGHTPTSLQAAEEGSVLAILTYSIGD